MLDSVKLAIRLVIAGALLNTLSACSLISDRTSEYMLAERGKSISIPQGLDSSRVSPRYPIPDVSNQKSLPKSFVLPKPPDATAALSSEPYLIETVENSTWLQLFSEPGSVWPTLEQFWSTYDLEFQHEDVTQGFLVTQTLGDTAGSQTLIAELEDGPYQPLVIEGMAFQLKLSQGVRRNTTEIRVRGLLPGESEEASSQWQPETINPRLEKGMLDLIGNYVTAENLDDRHSLLANEIGQGARVRLAEDEAGIGYLAFDLSFQRAWNELGQALDAAEIVVAEKDRADKTYYISYLSEDELDSWFSFASTIDEQRLERNLALRFSVSDEGEILVHAELLNDEFEPELPRQLLNIVYEYIS